MTVMSSLFVKLVLSWVFWALSCPFSSLFATVKMSLHLLWVTFTPLSACLTTVSDSDFRCSFITSSILFWMPVVSLRSTFPVIKPFIVVFCSSTLVLRAFTAVTRSWTFSFPFLESVLSSVIVSFNISILIAMFVTVFSSSVIFSVIFSFSVPATVSRDLISPLIALLVLTISADKLLTTMIVCSSKLLLWKISSLIDRSSSRDWRRRFSGAVCFTCFVILVALLLWLSPGAEKKALLVTFSWFGFPLTSFFPVESSEKISSWISCWA